MHFNRSVRLFLVTAVSVTLIAPSSVAAADLEPLRFTARPCEQSPGRLLVECVARRGITPGRAWHSTADELAQ
jgi:hypothetical protein